MAGAFTFLGGATAQAAGYDGVTAAQAATNEAVNNRLLHQKEITLIRSRAKDFARQLNGGKEPTPEQIAQAETRLLDQADRNVDQHSDLRLDGEANRFLTDLKRELAKGGQDTLPGGGQYFFASPDQYFSDRMYAETLNTPTGQQAYRQIQAGQTGRYLPGYYYKQGIADANREASRQAAAGAITAGAILAPWAVGACLTNPVACNQAGITAAEVLSEGGVVGGGVALSVRGGPAPKNPVSPGRSLTWYDPPNDGFLGEARDFILLPGARVDRYGRDAGRFLAPEGTPVPMRALPPGGEERSYSVFEVIKPLPVKAGEIAPAYGQPGLGLQFVTDKAIRDLINAGYLKRVIP
jgi:hypothetical protein